jgi:hypothetical protein
MCLLSYGWKCHELKFINLWCAPIRMTINLAEFYTKVYIGVSLSMVRYTKTMVVPLLWKLFIWKIVASQVHRQPTGTTNLFHHQINQAHNSNSIRPCLSAAKLFYKTIVTKPSSKSSPQWSSRWPVIMPSNLPRLLTYYCVNLLLKTSKYALILFLR